MKRAKKIAVIVLVFMLAISSCGLMQSSSVSAAKHSGKLAGRQTKSNALKEKWENRIKNKVYLGAVSPIPGRALKSRIIKEKVQYLSKKESMKRAKKRGTRPKFELPENIKEQLIKAAKREIKWVDLSSIRVMAIDPDSEPKKGEFHAEDVFEQIALFLDTRSEFNNCDKYWDYVKDSANNQIYHLKPFFIYSKDSEGDLIKKYDERLEKIASELKQNIKPGVNEDFQKALAIHDYLALTMEYDKRYIQNMYGTWFTPFSHTPIGGILSNTGVCESYTTAYIEIAKKLGLEVGYGESAGGAHIWNIVKVDGKWYNIDVTWDDTSANPYDGDTPGVVGHDYFLISHDELRESHDWSDINYRDQNFKKINLSDINSEKYDGTWVQRYDSPILMDKDNYYYFEGRQGNDGKLVKVTKDTETAEYFDSGKRNVNSIAMVKDRIFYTTKSGKQILSQKKDDLNAAPDQEYPKEAGNDSGKYIYGIQKVNDNLFVGVSKRGQTPHKDKDIRLVNDKMTGYNPKPVEFIEGTSLFLGIFPLWIPTFGARQRPMGMCDGDSEYSERDIILTGMAAPPEKGFNLGDTCKFKLKQMVLGIKNSDPRQENEMQLASARNIANLECEHEADEEGEEKPSKPKDASFELSTDGMSEYLYSVKVMRAQSIDGNYKEIASINAHQGRKGVYKEVIKFTDKKSIPLKKNYYKFKYKLIAKGSKKPISGEFENDIPALITPPLTPPSGLKAKSKKGKVRAKFRGSFMAKGYEIFRAQLGKKLEFKRIKVSRKMRFIDIKVKKKRVYVYYVRAYTIKNGKKVYSEKSNLVMIRVK